LFVLFALVLFVLFVCCFQYTHKT